MSTSGLLIKVVEAVLTRVSTAMNYGRKKLRWQERKRSGWLGSIYLFISAIQPAGGSLN